MTVSEALEQSKSFTMMHKGSIKATQRLILPAEDIIYAVVANIAKMPVQVPFLKRNPVVNFSQYQ